MKAPPHVGAIATLTRRCSSPAEAKALHQALAPDNESFLVARSEGPVLHLGSKAASLGELQRTLDDALACLSAAEKTWAKARSATGASEERPIE